MAACDGVISTACMFVRADTDADGCLGSGAERGQFSLELSSLAGVLYPVGWAASERACLAQLGATAAGACLDVERARALVRCKAPMFDME